MSQEHDKWYSPLFVYCLIILALVVFGTGSYLVLTLTTSLPNWAAIVISIPVAIGGFAYFVYTHRDNGF